MSLTLLNVALDSWAYRSERRARYVNRCLAWWHGARMRSTYLERTRTGTGIGNCLQKQMCPATRSRIRLQPSSHARTHAHTHAHTHTHTYTHTHTHTHTHPSLSLTLALLLSLSLSLSPTVPFPRLLQDRDAGTPRNGTTRGCHRALSNNSGSTDWCIWMSGVLVSRSSGWLG